MGLCIPLRTAAPPPESYQPYTLNPTKSTKCCTKNLRAVLRIFAENQKSQNANFSVFAKIQKSKNVLAHPPSPVHGFSRKSSHLRNHLQIVGKIVHFRKLSQKSANFRKHLQIFAEIDKFSQKNLQIFAKIGKFSQTSEIFAKKSPNFRKKIRKFSPKIGKFSQKSANFRRICRFSQKSANFRKKKSAIFRKNL